MKIKLFLFFICFAFFQNIFSQNLIITSNGQPVKDGDNIEIGYYIEDLVNGDFKMLAYTWNPMIEISTLSGKEEIWITLTAGEDSENFQICWPDACKVVMPGESVYANGFISEEPEDLQIHRVFYNPEEDFIPANATATLVIRSQDESFTINISCLPSDESGILNIENESSAKLEYYTLSGNKIERPSKGIYIRKQGKKITKIFL